MKLTLKQVFLILLLTLCAISSSWLIYKTIFKKDTPISRSNSEPNAILYNVTSIRYDINGHIKNHLQAHKLIYYAGLHKNIFLKPIIIVYKPGETPWHITADRGLSLNNNQTIKLIKNVTLKQNLSENNPASIILTSQLTVFPDKHIAETQKPLTYTRINQDKSKVIVKSIGAKVNQNTGEVLLSSKVRGSYAAHP